MSDAVTVRQLRKTYAATKKYPQKEALKGVDLTIPRGAFFALLGPNGAGKSTLINILAGLVVRSSGAASICGHDIEREMRAARRSIGVVPQELAIDTFFSVRETLEIYAGYYGVPKPARRTDEILNALGLADKASANPRQLSGGMKRRLLVAKALVHTPPVLILDEPTAGVDVELRLQLWDYVKELNRQGTTVLLTTHYLEEAQTLCDSLAVIHRGEMIASGRTQELLRGLDEKELVIEPATAVDTLSPALAALGARLEERGAIRFTYRPSRTSIADLLAAVQGEGIAIRDLATREPNLEVLFRNLTHG